MENGKQIYSIIQELKTAPLSILDEVIKDVAGTSINEESFQDWKGTNFHFHALIGFILVVCSPIPSVIGSFWVCEWIYLFIFFETKRNKKIGIQLGDCHFARCCFPCYRQMYLESQASKSWDRLLWQLHQFPFVIHSSPLSVNFYYYTRFPSNTHKNWMYCISYYFHIATYP